MADIFTNYLTGNDTTGNGSLATPYKTVAKALTVQVQGDTIKVMEDEPISVAWTLPVRSSRLTLNAIIGVNSLGVEDGTVRVITSTSGLANWMIGGNTWQWHFRNLKATGFTAFLSPSTATGFNSASFFNCEFASGGAVAISTAMSAAIVFDKCKFTDLAIGNVNYTLFGSTSSTFGFFTNCIFRRCSSLSVNYILIYALTFIDCMILDCAAYYGLVGVTYAMINVVIDRCRITATGNVTNSIIFYGANSNGSTYNNILITNCSSANTPTSAVDALVYFTTSTGSSYFLHNIASFNCSTFNNTLVKGSTTLTSIFGENVFPILSESPWKNDDGIIANPMASYEYKENYAWRRKQQSLTDISGWSYPT